MNIYRISSKTSFECSFVKFYGPFGGIVYEVGCLAYSILFKAIGVAVICYSLKVVFITW